MLDEQTKNIPHENHGHYHDQWPQFGIILFPPLCLYPDNILQKYHIKTKFLPEQNTVDPDQMPQNVASDLGLHCLALIQDTSTDREMNLANFRTSTVRSYSVQILRGYMVVIFKQNYEHVYRMKTMAA